MAEVSIPKRSEVAKEQTWNAELVFATRDEWHEELAKVGESTKVLSGFAGSLSSAPSRLAEWLEFHQSISRRVEKLVFYAYMASAVDSGDTDAVAMVGQAQTLAAELAAKSAFAEPELLGMDENVLKSWVESDESLAIYKHYLEDIHRLKPHYRSGEVEEVLGLVSDPFGAVYQTFQMLSSNDLTVAEAIGSDGSTHDVTQSNIESIKGHADREVRRTGMNNYADAYLALRHTFASNYIAASKQAQTIANIRGYESVLEQKLSPPNLPLSVFHTLIDAFQKNLSVWHRYWDVKRRVLKLDVMRPYDIWAPLTDKLPKFDYKNAIGTIANGMSPLGDAYAATLRQGCLENRWVDYAQNQGKSQGAFSYGTYDTHPCILTSFDGSITELSTLAHELGHSMHSYLSSKSQPYVYSDYSIFVAEVASNFNQAMVRESLFESNDDPDFQLAVIQEAMDNIHRYFFIMPTLARFEYGVFEKLKAGDPINADVLQEMMQSLYAEGYGDALEDDAERTSITWATFVHLYEPFYTFQYATGISAAHALCNRILAGAEGAADAYLRFLSLGSSVYPLDALKIAGVDMTNVAPIEAGFKALERLVDRLENLV